MSASRHGRGARAAAAIELDTPGQAALLLAEAMLHIFVERGLITMADAVAAVETAIEVKQEMASEAGGSRARADASLDLLRRIAQSFAVGGDAGGRLAPV